MMVHEFLYCEYTRIHFAQLLLGKTLSDASNFSDFMRVTPSLPQRGGSPRGAPP